MAYEFAGIIRYHALFHDFLHPKRLSLILHIYYFIYKFKNFFWNFFLKTQILKIDPPLIFFGKFYKIRTANRVPPSVGNIGGG